MGKLDPKHIENVLALTPLQEGILFHYLQDPQSEVYFAQLCLEISGEIDMSSFENAWNTVIETNEMLRTVFRWEKLEKPSQIILKEHKCKVIFYDLSDNGVFQKVKASEETKDRDRRETFDLHQVPFRITLCKMDEKKYEMIISNHHILYDGWSNGIILKEFFEAYHELCHGRGSIPIPVKPPFKEFIKWLHHRDKNQQEQSWREYLAGFETPSELPIKKRIDETTKAENYSFSLEEYIKGRLDDFVKNNRVTLASVFYTAWGILLQKYCDSEDVIFGTTVSGRSAGLTGIEDMVGLFINTIPLRVQSAPSDKMIDIVSAVERALQVREEFESTPLPDIRRYSTVGDCGRGSLFDMIVVIENYPLDNCLVPDSSNLSILSYAINELTHYDLTVSITLFSEIKVKFSYNRGHFDKSSIENLARHLKHILQSVIDNPTEAVSLLEVISGEEKNRILYEFNNTATEYPANKTIHQLFMEQAERTPDHIALVGVDPRVCAVSLSYRKLNKQSDWLSGLLIEKGVLPDTIVGIKMERSIEMIIGILGILKIGSAYLPIDPEYPQKRVSYMLRDSAAKILIDKPEARISKFETNSDVQKVNGQIKNRYLESTLVLNFEHLDFEYVCTCNFGFRISNFNPLNLAYIMYTSGSTGQPKGVMVSHRNAVRLVKNTNFVPLTEETRILQTGSPLFDAATFEILGSLLNGGQLILVDKEIIVDAQQLRDTLKDQHINTLWLSAPLFNQLQQQNIELFEPLSYLLVGGDVLSPEHINRVRHRFPFLKIINGYGPTENTTFSTTYLIEKEFEQRIPIGRPIANSTAYIYDKNNRMSPIGVWGELYVGGDGVACGYLNNPELTAERFKRDVISHSPLLINKPSNPSNDQYLMANDIFYKTGDLARWLPDGNIEFQGRIDKQVKIRGFRIELGEIERQLLEYGHIKEAVVIDRKTGEEKYICAYIVPDSNPAPEATELKSYLSRCLPGYMLPSFFVFMERIPLNQNGKIDQKALPEPGGGETTKEYTAPRDAVEKKLTEIWTEILKPNSFISIDENFFDLGGHSLNATQLTGRIHKVFNVKISLKEFFQSGCIREVAEYIKRAVEVEEEFTFIEPVEEKEYYPLSATQKRMYFLQQMDEAGIVYNIPSLMILEGVLDKNYLGSIFQKLIQRHESLRTSFITINDEPVQRIHDDVESDIEYKNSSTDYTVYTNKKDNCRGTPPWLPSIRSFDLSKAPLMRVELVEVEAEKNLLMVDMHHIITDGASMELFVKEFMELYAGLELPLLKLQYRDYVGWQSDKQKKNVLKTEEEYWLGQFREAPPVLDLPLDFPRPMVQSFGGRGYSFEITPGETTALKALALREGATLFIVLLSIYYVFLSRITGQEDIVAGTPVAGRSHTDLESIMGLFINTLALRNRPVWEKNFKEFLKEINENTLAAFANQDYPYEELVEKVTINREPGRNPLFDTMFTLQNTGSQEIKIPGLRLVPCEYENKTSKFDLSLTSVEVVGKLVFTFEYNTKLFREETIHRFNVYFKNIIHGIIECKERRVVDFKIVSEEEKNRILLEFNDVGVGYPKDRTIHQLFIEQASRTPDNIALLGADLRVCPPRNTRNVSLTYLELNKQSDRLAGLLIEKGVFPDTIVGIMVERSVEMIVGIMGILKSGCAYLPIDPGYSQERVNYMLQDSEVKLLVTINNKEGEKLRCWEGEIYYIEDPHRSSYFLSILPSNLLSSSYLAYLIYTSGSTGKPKGVMINHGSVVNLLFAMQDNYPFTAVDTYLLKTSIIFDVSVTELFGWSLGGGKLAVLEKAGERDPQVIIDWIEWYKVTHINFVPSMFNAFACRLDVENINRLSTLKYIFLAGETLLPEFVKKIRDMNTGIRLENIYGPTESTVYSSKYSLADWNGRGSIPIGKPMPNIKLYILDKNNNLQPLGIVGELAIAGVGLARGYLNRPELTAEKFKRNFISQLSLFISSNKNFANENSSNLTNDQCPLTNDYLYKTGDLARWRPDSNIEFLGRLDQQVKVRGFRVELGEIEGLLLKHDRVKNTVVVLKEDESGDNTLVAYFVSELELSDTGLREYLLKVLPDYMIPAYFVQMDKIPLTPSGKVDKRALPEPELKIGESYRAPRDEVERKLVELWSEVLGRDTLHASQLQTTIGISDNFFELGGHSLKATILVSKIHKAFHVNVPLAEIFKTPTILGLSSFITASVKERYISIEPVEKKEYYGLSSAQKRLYILHQMDQQGVGYNISSISILEGEIDKERLEHTFRLLIRRHESLRTSFHMINDEPEQRIHDEVEFEIEYFDLGAKNGKEHAEGRGDLPWSSFIRPFDISKAPLVRVGLVKEEECRYVLMVDIHHIISDGTSMNVVVKDFMELYREGDLPELRVQYKDFSEWQKSEKQIEIIKKQEDYWLRQFEGDIPILELPVDYARPSVQSFEGSHISFKIPLEITEALKVFTLKTGCTIYMVLLAIYSVVLAKVTNQDDMVIGSPIAGRRHADLEKIIGMFVNTLALRVKPSAEKTFTGFLYQVKEKALRAFENQDYQFEDLVERVVTNRDISRNPLFDVMFVLQNMEVRGIEIPGMVKMPYEYESKTSKFDMNLLGMEKEGELTFILEYSTKLFKEETARRFCGYFGNILNSVIENPAAVISAIEIMGKEEKERILEISNGRVEPIDLAETIHGMFEKVVIGNKDKTALVFRDERMSYGELNRRTNRLARMLRDKGVGRDSVVGLMVERSFELVVGMVGIMKAGGAYLPIDPKLPGQRKNIMIKDSNMSVLLTNLAIEEEAAYITRNIEVIDIGKEGIYRGEEENLANIANINKGTDLVYVIFTSGSTGSPKGVMLGHTNLVNLIRFHHKYTGIDCSKVLQFTTASFDVSFQEIFFVLLGRGELYLINENTRNNIPVLLEFIGKNKIKTLFLPMSFLRLIFEEEYIKTFPASVGHIITAGEQVVVNDRMRNCLRENKIHFYNHYGPSETHVITALALTMNPREDIPEFPSIGNPIMNTGVYILDKQQHLQPIGVAGELYAEGLQVGRGYLNRPELTAEKFISASSVSSVGKNIYKTGDLCKWLPDGNIEFLGRIDQQVKIRGIRVEPGEIESQLKQIAIIKESVVVVKQDKKGEKYLCAYIVLSTGIDWNESESRHILSGNLPDYMIPAYFVQMDKIPLTPSGKVDKRALPEPELKIGESYRAPRDEVERKLVELWSEVLGRDTLHASQLQTTIGISDNFFELGGHSLKATILVSKIHKAFHVNVPLAEIFKTPTILGLSSFITASVKERYISIEPVEKKEYYDLSFAQRRLYILDKTETSIDTAYNLPEVMLVEGELDIQRFEDTFNKLLKRYDSFRTSFDIKNGKPVQVIHRNVAFEITYISAEDQLPISESLNQTIKNFIRPFDLSKAPLLRTAVVHLSRREHFLLFDMHHIIADGVSMGILVRNFVNLYEGNKLPALKLQYIDFAGWQNKMFKCGQMKKQEEYWLKKFNGDIPVLNMPTDYPRQLEKSFAGNIVTTEIDIPLTDKIKTVILETGNTLYIVLLTVLNILLSKYTGQDDIIVGCPTAGRNHEDLENIIGMFVNTLAMRNYLRRGMTAGDFLAEVKKNALQAFENQDYPFEELVSQLKIVQNHTRNPLFDILFVSEKLDIPKLELEDLTFTPYQFEYKISHMDLVFYIKEIEGKIELKLEYATALFKKPGVAGMLKHYLEILEQVIDNVNIKLEEIKISHEFLAPQSNILKENQDGFGF